MMQRIKNLAYTLFLVTALAACDDGHLRGAVTPSEDGKTYFGVIDDNGGHCGPIMLDGREWTLPMGEIAEIEPGRHTLSCGGEIGFDVPAGVVFLFDYWGP